MKNKEISQNTRKSMEILLKNDMEIINDPNNTKKWVLDAQT